MLLKKQKVVKLLEVFSTCCEVHLCVRSLPFSRMEVCELFHLSFFNLFTSFVSVVIRSCNPSRRKSGVLSLELVSRRFT